MACCFSAHLKASENILAFLPPWNKWKIYQRKDATVDKGVDYPGMPFAETLSARHKVEGERRPVTPVDTGHIVERIILENYGPPCVLINERYEILYFIGQTEKHLSPPTGEANFNLLKMAKEEYTTSSTSPSARP